MNDLLFRLLVPSDFTMMLSWRRPGLRLFLTREKEYLRFRSLKRYSFLAAILLLLILLHWTARDQSIDKHAYEVFSPVAARLFAAGIRLALLAMTTAASISFLRWAMCWHVYIHFNKRVEVRGDLFGLNIIGWSDPWSSFTAVQVETRFLREKPVAGYFRDRWSNNVIVLSHKDGRKSIPIWCGGGRESLAEVTEQAEIYAAKMHLPIRWRDRRPQRKGPWPKVALRKVRKRKR